MTQHMRRDAFSQPSSTGGQCQGLLKRTDIQAASRQLSLEQIGPLGPACFPMLPQLMKKRRTERDEAIFTPLGVAHVQQFAFGIDISVAALPI